MVMEINEEIVKDDIDHKTEDNGVDFNCHICLDVARQPVVSVCGHLFCWPCLHRWLDHLAQCVNPPLTTHYQPPSCLYLVKVCLVHLILVTRLNSFFPQTPTPTLGFISTIPTTIIIIFLILTHSWSHLSSTNTKVVTMICTPLRHRQPLHIGKILASQVASKPQQ